MNDGRRGKTAETTRKLQEEVPLVIPVQQKQQEQQQEQRLQVAIMVVMQRSRTQIPSSVTATTTTTRVPPLLCLLRRDQVPTKMLPCPLFFRALRHPPTRLDLVHLQQQLLALASEVWEDELRLSPPPLLLLQFIRSSNTAWCKERILH